MSSFFKRPSWAKPMEENGTEFYRRSEQTYSDIIAANREAHQNPKQPEPIEDEPKIPKGIQGEAKKRRRISEQAAHLDSERSESDGTICTSKSQLLNSSSHSTEPHEHKAVQTHSPESHLDAPSEDPRSPDAQVHQAVQSAVVPSATEPPSPHFLQPKTPIDDPIVQIVISSDIENTTPLLVHRKMSQGLKEVRLAWCNRQNLAPETHSSIYLTWKGRRLFDVTTCRSLGLRTQSSMAIADIDNDLFAEAEQNHLRIHMAAVTDKPLLTNRPNVSEAVPDTPALSTESDQGESMKLVLRSPGYEDFKIKARQKTLISRLISAFRDKQNIPKESSIALFFDGDKLPPDSCIGDHEVDNLDLVDVQIR